MAKVRGPLFSMMVSGAIGEIVFDRRGFIRAKGVQHNPKTAGQGNFRQTLTAAQRCVQVCGPQTRQHLRAAADKASRWNDYLTRSILGPKRAGYLQKMSAYQNHPVDRAAWEAAAAEIGLGEVHLEYAGEGPISPGAQLFMLAATLYELGIYAELGHPAESNLLPANVAAWQESIIL